MNGRQGRDEHPEGRRFRRRFVLIGMDCAKPSQRTDKDCPAKEGRFADKQQTTWSAVNLQSRETSIQS